MDEGTLAGLNGAIAKWEGIVAGTSENLGPDNCPLCHIFLKHFVPDRAVGTDCHGCPVYQKTKKTGCRETPYTRYAERQGWYDELEDKGSLHARQLRADMQEYAEREVEFLKSLLP